LGAAQFVIVTDAQGRYAGVVYPPEAFGINRPDAALSEVLHHGQHYLLPEMTAKEAVAAFASAEADALAVLDGDGTRRVLGFLTEQHTLRRYNEELERRRRELAGE
jgi:CIC family chloride channel protein